MSNPFKRIIHHHSVPKVLKEKVLSDIGMIKFTLDIADLFLVKYPKTIGDFLSNDTNKSNRKN
ncbi:hypothetical protein [Polaribacter atrinae]|uniref:Uncharacterized protein n=1 Tax=Polaribacter atrinae TaxID=1333662 RepID=A0A176TEL6_9FLAO|nr:hypothetical protein [Polaribacter atrinae]OAD45836.1 hypothetical protein LPB303_05995 [Polaribacter atrinae]